MKKKAEDLKPGDVISSQGVRIVVVRVSPISSYAGGTAIILAVDLDTEKHPGITSHTLGGEFEVESPALTPAQQHAEEAVKLVRQAESLFRYRHTMTDAAFIEHRNAYSDSAQEFLARIDPPKPPSAEELAEALAHMSKIVSSYDYDKLSVAQKSNEVLDRARAAGMLKGGAQ